MKKAYTILMLCAMVAMPTMAQKQKMKKMQQEQGWQHPWRNRKVAYFGDSITDPRLSASKTKYWGFLEQWLGITSYVYGVSGKQWNDIPNQTDKLKAEHGEDFDAIIIFCGTNDFNAAVPIGEWYVETEDSVKAAVHRPAEMVLRRHRAFSMNKNTLRGRINIAMRKLKSMYPDKQIVLMTPIHRAFFASSNTNIQPDEMYQNECGEYFDQYVESVKEAGSIWSVPVIDLHSLSGLFPLLDEGAQLFNKPSTDRLHPNDKGHERMARTMECQLATIPCTF